MTELRGNRFGLSNKPEEILSILENIADVYGLCSPNQRMYYVWDWTTLRQINWLSLNSIKKYLGALRRGDNPTTYPSTCGANYLRVKNHYLGFYPTHDFIIKAFLNKDSYNRHIEGVQRFNEFGFQYVKAPGIQASSLDPFPHTLESYIRGDNYQIIPLDLRIELIQELADFHFQKMDEIEVLIEEEDKKLIVENLEKQQFSRINIDKVRTFLKQSSWIVFEGEIHGDLNQGNLIRGTKAVYLTDWEFFSRGPIAQDLVKLYYQAGERVRQTIVDVYQKKHDSLVKAKHTDNFLSSLLLYTLKALLFLYQESMDQLLKVHKDPIAAKEKTSKNEQNLISLIQLLLIDYEKQ